GHGDEGVPVVGRADGDGLDVAVAEDLAEVLDGATAAADDAGGEVAVVPVHVAHGDELHAAVAHGVLHDLDAALAVDVAAGRAARIVGADADGGHDDAVVGAAGLARRARRRFLLLGQQLPGVPGREPGGHQAGQRPGQKPTPRHVALVHV